MALDRKITLANIIQIALLSIGLVSGWTMVKAKVDRHEEQLQVLTVQQHYDTTDIAVIKSETLAIRRAVDRIEDRIMGKKEK